MLGLGLSLGLGYLPRQPNEKARARVKPRVALDEDSSLNAF